MTPGQPAAETTLLIVDDNPINIRLLQQIFQADHTVITANSGAQALERCHSGKPDLILLDVMMPDMDGHEVCRRLKADSRTAAIPVIFVTAQDDPVDEAMGLTLGAVDFITKPISASVVKARVRTHLALTQSAKLLAQSQQRMELALAGADLGLWDWDLRSGKLSHNARLASMLGYTAADLAAGMDFLNAIVHPDDSAGLHAAYQAHAKGSTSYYEHEHRVRHQAGHWVWVFSRGKVVERDADGTALRLVGTDMDISVRKSDQTKLQAREQHLANLIASLRDLVFVVSTAGQIVDYHAPASFQFPLSREAALGRDMAAVLPEDLARQLAEGMVGMSSKAESRNYAFTLAVNAAQRHFQAVMSQLADSEEHASGYLVLLRDITEARQAQDALAAMNAQLEALALTDGLTEVANRRRFDDVLAREWSRAARLNLPLALAMIDVDFFKKYNDRYGHQAGDDRLCRVARALEAQARRPGDLVARYGGEEFAMVFPGTEGSDALKIAAKACEALFGLGLPHDASPIGVLSISVGVAALRPGKEGSAESLVKLADQALYQAKEGGRNRAVLG